MIEQLASLTPTADELDRLTLVLVKELLAGGREDRRVLIEQWRAACGTGGLPGSVRASDVSSAITRVDKPPVPPDLAGTACGAGGLSASVLTGDVSSKGTLLDKPAVPPKGESVVPTSEGAKTESQVAK